MTYQTQAARELLRIQAVFLSPDEPFTWASGIQSPIYCDNRLILSDVSARAIVEKGLSELIKDQYPEAQMIMGTATAGIAHAALVADILKLPMGYVRGSEKGHGRKNRIEGKLEPGTKVVVLEDLISTGGSVLACVEALREAGAEVLGVVSIFTYGMKRAAEAFEEAHVPSSSLSNLDTLLEVALDLGVINQTGKEKLLAFRNNPTDESWMKVGSND